MGVPEHLAEFLSRQGPWQGRRVCVAYSGGLDSTVLLHALAGSRRHFGFELIAAHVHHGLQPAADDWAAHCRAEAATRGIAFHETRIRLGEPAGLGLEAQARALRYAALAAVPCDTLMLGHHQDDQAETVLLAMLRGAGPAGLSAMSAVAGPAGHPLAQRVLRPWLGISREVLRDWARAEGLRWIEDPSNAEPVQDRNYLRLTVGPALSARFPAWRSGLARSAEWAAEAQELLEALAQLDLAPLAAASGPGHEGVFPGRVADYLALPPARCRNLLRYLTAELGAAPPPAPRLAEWMRQLAAADDRIPALVWGRWSLRRWGGRLWFESQLPESSALTGLVWSGREETQLELPGRGCLEIRACHVQAPAAGRTGAAEALGTLRADCGPLRIAPCHLRAHLHLHSGGPGRELRKLFQEAGIPPWRRARMPAVYSDRTLVAVAGLAVAAEWRAGADSHGWRLLWHDAAVRTGDYWHGQQRSAVV